MAKSIRPIELEKQRLLNGYSPFRNEMYVLCSRRQFLYQKGKLGPARCGEGRPPHDIVTTNIIWCTAYKRGVGKRRILRNSRAIVLQ